MEHFNKLIPAEAERLALLSEECAEVIQAIGKILRHGYESRHTDGGPTNRESLQREIGHVWAAQALMANAGDVELVAVSDSMCKKLDHVQQYLHHNQVATGA